MDASFCDRCQFSTFEQCQDWLKRLNNAIRPPSKIEDLFSFAYHAWCMEVYASEKEQHGDLCRPGMWEHFGLLHRWFDHELPGFCWNPELSKRNHPTNKQTKNPQQQSISIIFFFFGLNYTWRISITGTGCPRSLWMSHPWRHSRPGWMWLWASWSGSWRPYT